MSDNDGISGLVVMGLLTLFPGVRKFLGFFVLTLLIAGVCLYAYSAFDDKIAIIRIAGFFSVGISFLLGLFWIGSHFVEMVGNRVADKFSDHNDDDEEDEVQELPWRSKSRSRNRAEPSF
jgi:hypothetical protein